MQRIAYKHSDINSASTSRTLHVTEDIKPSAPIELQSEEVLEEQFDTFAGFTPKTDYKPKFTPKTDGDSKPRYTPKTEGESKPKYTPKTDGDSKPPSKYFGKSGDQTEVSKNCIMCKKEHMLWQCPEF